MLGKRRCLRCGQPLLADLDHRVSELCDGRSVASIVCNMLCQRLGVAPEEGAYSRDKMSDPAYKPPTLSTSVKVAKRGAYMRDTTVIPEAEEQQFKAKNKNG